MPSSYRLASLNSEVLSQTRTSKRCKKKIKKSKPGLELEKQVSRVTKSTRERRTSEDPAANHLKITNGSQNSNQMKETSPHLKTS
jgi:hypothetical protein